MNEKVLSIIVKAQDEASKVFQKLEGHSEEFSAGMRKASVVVAAAGIAVTAFAKNSNDHFIETARNAMRLARETGMTAEEASKLSAVASRMGVDVGEASAMFGLFSKQIVEARQDITDTENPVNRLGVAVKNADGSARGFHDILLNVADRFKSMPDGAEKTALALELFGRSGKALLPVLNQGAQGIVQLEQEAEKLGITLSSSNIASVQAYIQAQKGLADSTNAIKMAVGTLTAPVLTNLQLRLTEVIQGFLQSDGPMKTFIINALAFGGPVMAATSAVLGFAGSLAQVGVTLRGLAAFMLNPFTLLFVAGMVAATLAVIQLRDHMGSWTAVANAAKDKIMQLWSAVSPVLTPALNLLGSVIMGQLVPALVRLWQQVGPILTPTVIGLAAVIGGSLIGILFGAVAALTAVSWAVSHMVGAISNGVGSVRNFASNVSSAISSVINWFRTGESVAWGAFGGIARSIMSVVGAINPVIGAVERLIGVLRSAGGAVESFKSMGRSLHIPGFATGVRNFRGGLAVVGEQGPELVNLPKGSDVYTNQESAGMVGGTVNNFSGNIYLTTAQAVDRFADRFELGDYGVGV